MMNLKKDNVLRLPYDAPPGYEWWEFDQATIEPRVNAWLAECPNLKEIFVGGTDLYLTIANTAWELGHDPSVLYKGYAGIPEKVRDDSKVGFLAVTYNLSPETWVKRYKGDMDQVLEFFENFNDPQNGFPELLLKDNSVKDLVMRGLPVSSPNGRTRTFPLQNQYPEWDYETFKLIPFWKWARELNISMEDQHILREAYNFIIQGFASDMNCKAAKMFDYRGPRRGCHHRLLKPFGTGVLHSNIVHDSVWMLLKKAIREDAAHAIRTIMTKELYDYLEKTYGWDLPIEIEAKFGPNLGEMKKYVFAPI